MASIMNIISRRAAALDEIRTLRTAIAEKVKAELPERPQRRAPDPNHALLFLVEDLASDFRAIAQALGIEIAQEPVAEVPAPEPVAEEPAVEPEPASEPEIEPAPEAEAPAPEAATRNRKK